MKLLKVPATLEGISKRLGEIERALRRLQKRAFLTPFDERMTREMKLLRLFLKDRAQELSMSPVPVRA